MAEKLRGRRALWATALLTLVVSLCIWWFSTVFQSCDLMPVPGPGGGRPVTRAS